MTHEPPDLLGKGHPFRQWKTWTIPGTGYTLSGYSRAGDKTFFHIPELRCALDAGLCEGRRADTVLLTHTHADHAKDLDYLAGPDADVFLPAEAVPYADDFIRASARLNHGAGYDPRLTSHRLHGVVDGDEFRFGKREHHVRVVGCDHKVPCVGYAVSQVVKALRPEYRELQRELTTAGRGAEFGKTMARLRAEGTEVDEEVRKPVFAFLGDTAVSVFDRNAWLLDFPVVITECSFLHDSELARADRDGHTVWSRLRPIVEAHPRTLFVLTHFSLRHTDREVADFFTAPGMPGNVLTWAHPESRLPEQHRRES
ncbi:MBL fold metallo-hydrolase [Phytomonospora endophytica]|uniref:Ribonuclease Z n=1 Tax=Phytomonospora endophytica TaxID=714109 RepID=A0A841FLA1_9ACTN|nr:MBL fold metallo-hydrolase [Phytomonospora endophytica]MBB6036715.1 ribonuclease Z [Phytomonospora endophytica]GIG68251.1 hypothetical protein Pen01_45460 [Phytomonospora endophytica]